MEKHQLCPRPPWPSLTPLKTKAQVFLSQLLLELVPLADKKKKQQFYIETSF